jgi:hypothetical protein
MPYYKVEELKSVRKAEGKVGFPPEVHMGDLQTMKFVRRPLH